MAEFKRRKRRPKVKFKVEDINYKNVELLKNFMNDKGKISPARVTGLDAKIQRKIAAAIKRSRQIALLPYTKIERYDDTCHLILNLGGIKNEKIFYYVVNAIICV